jgi:hypothetical protein
MDDDLRAVLNTFPVAAELYENINYQHAGLVRAPLEASLNSELKVKDVLAKMRLPR